MWNLIVSADETAWEGTQRMKMDRARFGEYSGHESAAVDLTDPASRDFLERVYSVLMYEVGVPDPSGAVVRIGHLRGIQSHQGGYPLPDIHFRFREKGRITQQWIRDNAHRLDIDRWELCRTHWAVKDGELPQDLLREMSESLDQYDVVVSFAGEQREYVEAFVDRLASRGVDVFYDRLEEAHLWGKNLIEHFQRVYRDLGRYCVMFVSEEYADKVWTRHERRSALERALRDRHEYILPVRFDDVELEGLSNSIGYVSVDQYPPEALASLLLTKLGRHP
jgi:hypothetical protein